MRLLDERIKEILDNESGYVVINVDSTDRLEHIIEIINSYRTIKVGVVSSSEYLQYMKEQNKCLFIYMDSNKEIDFKCTKKEIHYFILNEIISDVDILKPVTPKPIHDAVHFKHNSNIDNMLENFFDALTEITIEPIKNKPKGKEMSQVKVFEKGKLDIKQVVGQSVIKNIIDKRPFVNKLLEKEYQRIIAVIKTLDLSIAPDTYNIRLLHAYKTVKEIQDNDFVQTLDIDDAYLFYIYEKETKKESNPKTRVDYSWIGKALTHENLNNPGQVDLFESRKFYIYIKDGRIFFHTLKTGVLINLEIKYNSEENTFHL